MAFELEVTSDKGDRLSVAQPEFHVHGVPRTLVLAPGADVRLVMSADLEPRTDR